MPVLLVVNNPDNWPLSLNGVEVVAARQYLTDPAFSNMRYARVFNLCRSYSYQSLGYYVSLLAEARGHKPQPGVTTIQDIKSAALTRVISDDLDRLIQKTLHQVPGESFTLSIYFGQTLAKRDTQLGARLFGLFPCPMMRAQFSRKREEWLLQGIRPIPASELSETHRQFAVNAANEFFARRDWTGPRAKPPRYHLAILHDPAEEQGPSDEAAINKFIRAAYRHEMGVELITRDDFGRIGEFDALFIRTTTFVNHHTYRFASRAAAEGLAVIDDPVSIARCTNKVYLAERLAGNDVPIPKTMIVHRDNTDSVLEEIGLPCVLKQPDSAFSMGVVKAHTKEEYTQKVEDLLENSEMVVAQEFLPTDYDWRVGVLDGKPLYVCKYYMARKHWQILSRDAQGKIVTGNADCLAVEAAPKRVVGTAVRAAKLIGDGLYGVDLKQVNGRVVVIEVNDNPSLDSGVEDRVLKDELYNAVIRSFIRRIEAIREGGSRRGRRASNPAL
ncbi:MAG: ATP-grasp domain-containing protein [Phycisphaera sp.]|nr:ATP-grasp domain-containing protein [Phycisphaera sp.]